MKTKRLHFISLIAIVAVAAVCLLRALTHRRPFQVSPEDLRVMEMIGKATEKLARLSPAEVERATTSNWKIYRDKEHHFEIKYPPEWYLQPEGVLYLIEHLPAWGVESSAFGPSIGFQAEEMKLSSPEAWLQEYLDQPWSPVEKPKYEWTSINNLQAARIEVPGWVTHGTMLNYMIFQDRTVYEITLSPYDPSDHKFDGLNALFLKIVSTLKFTDSVKP